MSKATNYLVDLFGGKPDAPSPEPDAAGSPDAPTPEPAAPLEPTDARAVWQAALDRLAPELPPAVMAACRAADARWEPDAAADDSSEKPAPAAESGGDPARPRAVAAGSDEKNLTGQPAALDDGPLDFDALDLPGEPCGRCGGLEPWIDGTGARRCGRCDGDTLARSIRLADAAARSRQRWPAESAPRAALDDGPAPPASFIRF